MNVAVHTNIDASAPVQLQSDVTCHSVPIDTLGDEDSDALQNVAVTVSRPDVASDAIGSLFTVDGSRLHVASNSDVCNARLDVSV